LPVPVPTKIVNLTVHGIGTPIREFDPGEDAVWIAVDQFEQVLDAVAGRSDVRLTVDDGNESDVRIALPLLVERGLRAEFFVPAGLLGRPGRLTADGVRELARAGMTIGSHGWGHRDWRRLAPGQGREEFTEANQVLEPLAGRPVTAASIPFGSYDRHVLRQLREAGYARVYSSDGGPADPDASFQARTSLPSTLDTAWISQVLDGSPSLALRARRVAARTIKRHRG
jgi:peptidoglycan/xylan/chitin deacetylase (PgdA/CDA1 family)